MKNHNGMVPNNQIALANSFFLDEDIRLLLEAKKKNPSFQLTAAVKKRLRDINKRVTEKSESIDDFQNKNLLEQMQNEIDLLKASKSSLHSDGFFAALIKWNYNIDASNTLFS